MKTNPGVLNQLNLSTINMYNKLTVDIVDKSIDEISLTAEESNNRYLKLMELNMYTGEITEYMPKKRKRKSYYINKK